jgi:sulfur-oxidizing protein SoxY
MIDSKRRILLKSSLAAGSVGVAIGAGLLSPRLVLAAWNEAAFTAKDVPSALSSLLGGDATESSDAIQIKAPDIAENGAVVPVTVETSLEGVKSIAIIASGNATPLVASFDLG